MDAAILWPAPGFPAFLEPPDRRLDLIVASPRPHPEMLRRWAQQIALTDRGGRSTIPLSVEEIRPADPRDIAERAARFAALPSARGLSFSRIHLRAPQFPQVGPDPRVQLFDVRVAGVVERPRAVAVFPCQKTTLNLAFAADLHVALLWDELAAAVNRYAPELGGVYVDPHRLADRFIDEANALWARGDLDLIVLGGDLVDHVYPHRQQTYRPNGTTNVSRLLTLLGRLDVPTMAVIGNHDCRCYPRRCRSGGLEAVGLRREQSRSMLRKAGLWDRPFPAPGDIDALRTSDAAGMDGLSDYLTRVAPVTDYCCTVRGLRLVVASSGCDVLARWREVEPARWSLLLRSLATARSHPDSEGLHEAQLTHIRGTLQDGRGVALFFHAPLLATRGTRPIESHLARLDLAPQTSLSARVRFERQLQQAGVRCGVSFRNPGALLQNLAGASGPIATFSGHAHRASAVEIDRRTMRIRSIEPRRAASRPGAITLLTAPAVGQLGPGGTGGPGYFLARFADGALGSLDERHLAPAL